MVARASAALALPLTLSVLINIFQSCLKFFYSVAMSEEKTKITKVISNWVGMNYLFPQDLIDIIVECSIERCDIDDCDEYSLQLTKCHDCENIVCNDCITKCRDCKIYICRYCISKKEMMNEVYLLCVDCDSFRDWKESQEQRELEWNNYHSNCYSDCYSDYE